MHDACSDARRDNDRCRERLETARWPAVLEPWLPPRQSADCRTAGRSGGSINITGLSDGAVIRRAPGQDVPKARLEIRGFDGEINWMVNGRLINRQKSSIPQILNFPEAGRYDITAFDSDGRYGRISVSVR